MAEHLLGAGSVLILGGGIAGVSAASNLSEAGFKVYLIEKNLTIGGHMAQLDKTYPTNDCSLCILAPKLVEVARDPNIKLYTNSELVKLEGVPGKLRATILKKPRYVEGNRCKACGDCAKACPVGGIPDEFNYGLGVRHAIYIPFPSAVPATFAIDPKVCLHFNYQLCETCSKVCKAGAINYNMKPDEIILDVGAVIIATGFDEVQPEQMPFYKKFREVSPNVLMGMEFERLMCASGPTGGHVVRRSDGHPAKRIAFVQCVGSRNIHDKNAVPYCSRICCMYATKQAVITKEHAGKDVDCYIFNPESRVYEKNFQEYVNRARNEYGVHFVPGRIGDMDTAPGEHEVTVIYEDHESGRVHNQKFDLVILECAVVPSNSSTQLAKVIGGEIDPHGWFTTESLKNLENHNVFVCGCALTPMNVQESVASGWSAAGKAMVKLADARGSEVIELKYPAEILVSPTDDPRIGVLICRCGTNIGGYVNVPKVVEYVRHLPKVVVARENMYSCSSDSQEQIKNMIKEFKLNRFIVASCTPRTHEPLFQATLREAAVNPYLFELVNIRDQDSWVHMNEPEAATEKACDLIRMHVAKVAALQPQIRQKVPVTQKVCVIGGGLSGLTAALNIAQQGIPVTIIEKEKKLGGIWDTLAPSYDGSYARGELQALVKTITSSPTIGVKTNTRLTGVSGFVGNYNLTLETAGEQWQDKVGSIIVATGVVQAGIPDAYTIPKQGKILSQTDFEQKLVSNQITLPPNVRIVFQQCAGQRGDPMVPHAFTGCTNICCESTLKLGNLVLEKYPGAQLHILHRGMQLSWKPSEEIARAMRKKAIFQRYDPIKGVQYSAGENGVVVQYYNAEVGENFHLNTDLAVLATPFGPEAGTEKLGPILKVPLTADGFFLEAHVKLRPLDFATDGIFLAGSAQYPKNAVFAQLTGEGAAGRAVRLLAKGYVETEGITAEVDQQKCIGCTGCVDVCPFGAIQLQEITINLGTSRYPRNKIVRKAIVVPASCKGCGTCVATCPKKAISQHHFSDRELLNMIEVFRAV